MSSQKPIFAYNRPPITLVFAVLLTGVTSCFVSLFVTLAYIGWLEDIVGIRPLIVFLMAWMGIFTWLTVKSVRGWFWALSIDDNRITLKPFIGQSITLNREDIQKLEEDNKKVIFSTVSKKLELDFTSLPIKSKVELFDLLPTWLPSQALPPEMQAWAREVKKLAVEVPPHLEKPIRASASLRHTLNDPGHVAVVIMGLIVIASVIFGVLSVIGFGIVSLITILICLAFAGAVFWSILNKHIEISNEGLEYQVGFHTKSFLWDDIETIAVQPHQGQITVWVKGRYSRIPVVGLNPEQLVLFQEAFSRQVFTRQIPFGYA